MVMDCEWCLIPPPSCTQLPAAQLEQALAKQPTLKPKLSAHAAIAAVRPGVPRYDSTKDLFVSFNLVIEFVIMYFSGGEMFGFLWGFLYVINNFYFLYIFYFFCFCNKFWSWWFPN